MVNEKGEEWGRITNGVTGSKLDENHEVLFFQSNYFTQPRKLFLRSKSIRALNKEDTRVTLDLKREIILEGPPNLVLDKVIKNPSGEDTKLHFLLKTDPVYDQKHGFSIVSHEFIDARGNSFNIKSLGTSIHSDTPRYDQTLIITLPDNQSYHSPITFQIQDFPSRISGKFMIQIK